MPEPDPVRAEGPPLVTTGRPGAPRLVVLDPAGAAKHDDVPATWRPLADDHEILWCRLPVTGAWDACARVLAEPGPRTDIIASGPEAGDALRLAGEQQATIRAVLLVDPATARYDTAEADDAWLVRNGDQVAALRDAGVEVEVIAHSSDDPDDRIPAPLPLGHPRVVEALRKALDELPAVGRPAL